MRCPPDRREPGEEPYTGVSGFVSEEMPNYPMTCERARELLWPDPAAPAPADARRHYDGCGGCRRFFAEQQQLGTRLTGLPRPPAPPTLRARVRQAIERETPASRFQPRPVWWAAAGLAAAAALAIAVGLGSGPRADDPAAPFVAHLEPRTLAIASADHEAVEAWLAAQLQRPVELPAITQARLRGARIVQVDGMTSAAAVYEMHGSALTYFVMPGFRVAGLEITPEMEIRTTRSDGYHVAIWGEADGARALAAAMAREEVTAIATECRMKALLRSSGLPVMPARERRSREAYPAPLAG